MIEENTISKNNNVSTGTRTDIEIGKIRMLLELLYDGVIDIEDFKEYCSKNSIDYNLVEHCCGCAGCYDTEKYPYPCPDFETDIIPFCQIMDPNYCNICGKQSKIGYPLTNDKDEEVYTFWTCDDHSFNKDIEKDLKKGTSIDTIVKKYNK